MEKLITGLMGLLGLGWFIYRWITNIIDRVVRQRDKDIARLEGLISKKATKSEVEHMFENLERLVKSVVETQKSADERMRDHVKEIYSRIEEQNSRLINESAQQTEHMHKIELNLASLRGK